MRSVMNMQLIDVRPVTERQWDDVVTVFGRRGSDQSWCWCRRFLAVPADQVAVPREARDNRAALRDEIVAAEVPPGLVAYVNGHPLGWTRVGPRDRFPGVSGNGALVRLLEPDPGAWWVTCFVVDGGARSQGVGTALLRSAVAHARQHGATCVEGHPVDVSLLKGDRVSPSAIFTGAMAMFVATGFQEVGRTYVSRPVMRVAF